MNLTTIITAVVIPVVMGYIGYNERDKAMLKQKLDKAKEDASQTKAEVQVLYAKQADIKDDLKRIEKKLDALLDALINRGL